MTKGSIEDTTEASDEIVTLGKDWLTYNVTKGFYVFDGTKVKKDIHLLLVLNLSLYLHIILKRKLLLVLR